jgi:hypothetical protein
VHGGETIRNPRQEAALWGGGGGVTIVYSPTVHVSGTGMASPAQIVDAMDSASLRKLANRIATVVRGSQ